MKSSYRTPQQQTRIASAESVGYVWKWDADYQLKIGRARIPPRVLGCISVLFGNTTGHQRAMIVYPDGSVETKVPERGGAVRFSRGKLVRALRAVGIARDMRKCEGRKQGNKRLVYNKATKKIDVIASSGIVMESFDPPEDCA